MPLPQKYLSKTWVEIIDRTWQREKHIGQPKGLTVRKLSILAIAFFSTFLIFTFGAAAASPKAGDACQKRNEFVTIGGKKFVCDVIPDQWTKTKKMYWQDIDKYSKAIDKLTSTFDEKTMYQHCITVNGGPLPGKAGKVPDSAMNLCKSLPGAPKPAGAANNSSKDPSKGFPDWVAQKYLDCLTANGFSPPNLNELMANIHTAKYEPAYKACNSLAPSLIASQFK